MAEAYLKKFGDKQFITESAGLKPGKLNPLAILLKFLSPENINLGSTIPAGFQLQTFIPEFILAYFLMLVILHVSQGSKETGVLEGIAIGGRVGLEAMFAGPVSGASMNPARSLVPAIISGSLQSLWIYLIAPAGGAVAATLTWSVMNPEKKVKFS